MKWNDVSRSTVLLAASCASLMGQSGTVVMAAGYQYPAPLYLAPGQMITLFVAPVSGIGFARAPANSDLPASLGGVHAGMTDSTGTGFLSLTAPILEVRHLQPCLNGNAPACFASPSYAVTIQIPYELRGSFDSVGVAVENATFDVLSSTDVWVTSDQVHILKALDSVLPITAVGLYGQCRSSAANSNYAPENFTGLPCPPIVTHTDGSLVTTKNPAKAGEELVAYAVGLGQTSPPQATGKIVKAPAPTLSTFTMDFNYRPNALATRPPPPGSGVSQPLYAGVTPGYVGLYQINFVVPPVPPGTPPCADIVDPLANVVYSNLTVSVGGRYSFDGAGICVAVDAAGLGQTNPPQQTGKTVTTPARTQATIGLDFNYHPNALASKPLPNAPPSLYSGATPGFVGLYQINFAVPAPPPGTPPCVVPKTSGENVIYSNLTVSVGGASSVDAARLCVAVNP